MKLYKTVQSLGGLKQVIERQKWTKVAEMLQIPKTVQDRVTKLDDIYCKYLLPYETLSEGKLMPAVDSLVSKPERSLAQCHGDNFLRRTRGTVTPSGERARGC